MAADDDPIISFYEFYTAKPWIAGADLTAARYQFDFAPVLQGRRHLEEAERAVADAFQQVAICLFPASFAIIHSRHPPRILCSGGREKNCQAAPPCFRRSPPVISRERFG
jgi:hypothetical protein